MIAISILYFKENGFVQAESIFTFYIMILFLFVSMFWLLYEIYDYIKYQKRKKTTILSAQNFSGVTEIKNKEYYFNLKIRSNDKEFQVYDDNGIKIFLNKQKKKLEIYKIFGKKDYTLDEIEFLVFEFLTTYLYTFIHNFGKIKWYCNYLIKLKNSNDLIPIVSMISDRDTLYEMYEFEDMDTDKFYYKQGLEIAQILSANLGVKYTILNQNEKETKK